MKIECILKRVGGSAIELGKKVYNFLEQEDGAHIAEVTDKEHIQRLLSIPEAYRIYDPNAPIKSNTELLGSSVHPATFEIGDTFYQLGDVVARAHADSGLSVEDWNDLADEDRADRIDAALDKIAEEAGKEVNEDLEITELRAKYKEKFGKPAHHAMKVETLREKLAE